MMELILRITESTFRTYGIHGLFILLIGIIAIACYIILVHFIGKYSILLEKKYFDKETKIDVWQHFLFFFLSIIGGFILYYKLAPVYFPGEEINFGNIILCIFALNIFLACVYYTGRLIIFWYLRLIK